jgi:hypothetical protein
LHRQLVACTVDKQAEQAGWKGANLKNFILIVEILSKYLKYHKCTGCDEQQHGNAGLIIFMNKIIFFIFLLFGLFIKLFNVFTKF